MATLGLIVASLGPCVVKDGPDAILARRGTDIFRRLYCPVSAATRPADSFPVLTAGFPPRYKRDYREAGHTGTSTVSLNFPHRFRR